VTATQDEARGSDNIEVTRVRPEWCAAETGGVVFLLILTSVRTAWLQDMSAFIRAGAARRKDGRTALMTVFRLDKRYPLDLGFDGNLRQLGDGLRDVAPAIRASARVLEFDGMIAFTMKAALVTLGFLARYPTRAHSTVVSGASWLAPYVSADERRSVDHYVDAVNRMKTELGCDTGPSAAGR
jgi:hypothetical protein